MEQHPQQPDGSAFPSGRLQLRPYQLDVISQCRQRLLSGVSKICLVAPTGAGKTIIAAEIICNAVANGKRVLVMGHTREIIKQISTKLFAHDLVHGVIQAGFMTRPDASVQVASIQTLWARAIRANRMELPSADLLIIDEAHHCPANTYRKIIHAYPHGADWVDRHAVPR
jgi:DNA repair protein RadD